MLHPFFAVLSFPQGRKTTAEVTELNETGVRLRITTCTPAGRHLWLRFGLPDGSGSCLALGEIHSRTENTLQVNFKHLFPDARRALNAALERVEPMARVA